MARACSSVKPSCWRRWTTLRVSKWWSLAVGEVAEKARRAAWWMMEAGDVRLSAQALRAKAAVAANRSGRAGLFACGARCWVRPRRRHAVSGMMGGIVGRMGVAVDGCESARKASGGGRRGILGSVAHIQRMSGSLGGTNRLTKLGWLHESKRQRLAGTEDEMTRTSSLSLKPLASLPSR